MLIILHCGGKKKLEVLVNNTYDDVADENAEDDDTDNDGCPFGHDPHEIRTANHNSNHDPTPSTVNLQTRKPQTPKA